MSGVAAVCALFEKSPAKCCIGIGVVCSPIDLNAVHDTEAAGEMGCVPVGVSPVVTFTSL